MTENTSKLYDHPLSPNSINNGYHFGETAGVPSRPGFISPIRSQSAIFPDQFPTMFNPLTSPISNPPLKPFARPSNPPTKQYPAQQMVTSPTNDANGIAARSVPVSRRNSNEFADLWQNIENYTKQKDTYTSKPAQHRLSSSPSMPPHFNSSLFDDDNDLDLPADEGKASSYVRRFLQQTCEDGKFPILVKRDDVNGTLSASSAALDLASFNHHFDHHLNTTSQLTSALSLQGMHPLTGHQKSTSFHNRYSLTNSPPSLPSDRPGLGNRAFSMIAPKSNLNHFHQNSRTEESHRQPQNKDTENVPAGICRYYLGGHCAKGDRCIYIHSTSPPNAKPVSISGPLGSQQRASNQHNHGQHSTQASRNNNNNHGASHNGSNNTSGNNTNNSNTPKSNSRRVNDIESKTSQIEARFTRGNEDLVGEIYPLCKDQHGCRYIQKRLEDPNSKFIDQVYSEVLDHFVELMTDPFGNYLCQKLLEHCSDAQRYKLVAQVSSDLIKISLNMHGTRAVQKMIEFLSSDEQVKLVTNAIGGNVVTLIKDLNGNHVIQKCLNRLRPEDNQFIYDSVCKDCIVVATHRHGCCVLQRCIDHASKQQKDQLVAEINRNGLELVQDPFGNYVVQYVLDLGIENYSSQLIRHFFGHVCSLSMQKFSSNVIEKCIRVAQSDIRSVLIQEIMNKDKLVELMRDSYANYVVQTSLDYALPDQRNQLIEVIKPLLPHVRTSTYGKRIQTRLQKELNNTGHGHESLYSTSGSPPHAFESLTKMYDEKYRSTTLSQ